MLLNYNRSSSTGGTLVIMENASQLSNAELEAKRNNEHINLLAIFYYIAGILSLFGGFMAMLVIVIFLFLMSNSQPDTLEVSIPTHSGSHVLLQHELPNQHPSNFPPQNTGAASGIFIVLVLIIFLFSLAQAIINILSGRFMKQRKHRTFSLIVAGLNCLSIPLGLALGIFTFVVLTRSSVVEEYKAGKPGWPPVKSAITS